MRGPGAQGWHSSPLCWSQEAHAPEPDPLSLISCRFSPEDAPRVREKMKGFSGSMWVSA